MHFILLILWLATSTCFSQSSITISVESDVYEQAQAFIDNRDVLSITRFNKGSISRDVVEFILLQQALKLGGFHHKLIFVTGNYDSRNLILLQQGRLLLSVDTLWLTKAKTLSQDLYISEPIIKKGEYFVGLYTHPKKAHKLKIQSIKDLASLSAVSNQHWTQDWQTLLKLPLKHLYHEEEWAAMARMVSHGWIDFMLAPFTSSQPFQYYSPTYRIQAINGVKLLLNDSRHFVISKHHPLGKQAFNALTKGLKILRTQDRINQAYIDCGFFNQATKNWLIINNYPL